MGIAGLSPLPDAPGTLPDLRVVIEEVPWASGKHQFPKVHMQFLAHWARKLSWKETAASFRTSWEKVCPSVEYGVGWGLQHRTLAPIRAIGVDEIQYAKGHKYLTLVYQIDAGLTRLLWVGKERTVETFQGLFAMIGVELTVEIEFVCSDMWKPYLRVIREQCSQALHILDRFHIVAKMNEALDDVRRRVTQDGPRRPRAPAEEVPLVCPQAQRESDPSAEVSPARSAAQQSGQAHRSDGLHHVCIIDLRTVAGPMMTTNGCGRRVALPESAGRPV